MRFIARLIRYVCFYCFARLLYNTARAVARRPAPAAKPCPHHARGLLLTLALLPFAGAAALCVLGFMLRP